MIMDFKRICRICLESNKQTFDIYTCYYMKRNTLYSDMLSTCTKLEPHINDGLPRLICKDCCRQLKRTYTFNLQCEESDIKLRTYLENVTNTNSNGDDNITTKSDIKIEGIAEEEINGSSPKHEIKEEHLLNNIFSENTNKGTLRKDDIKLEPNYTDEPEDSCWDAEDDNLLLEEIKSKKNKDSVNGNLKKEKQTKKKRGRKKKVYAEGELRSRPESKLPHQCDICGKFLSTKSNLKAHKICHTDLRPHKCSECPASFRGYSALFQHRKVHTRETPYHCEYCPKQFSRRTGLINHIRMHTGEKLFSCEICMKNFVQSAQLSIHMKRHKGDKSYLCQECGKGFPVKADLRVHQRVHNGDKPYSCHLCPKTFATSGNLSIHIRIHNKDVRYHCKECERGFVSCSAYNVHLKRHKGQRDYICECGKTFYTSSALKQHKVVHTGEKKYQCKICDRKFSQTSHLTRHFKRDHAKPNAPLPPSTQYRLVVTETEDIRYLFDVQKVAPNTNSDIKYETS